MTQFLAVKEDSVDLIFLFIVVREEIEETLAAQPCEFSSHYIRYGPLSQRNYIFLARKAVRF